MTRVSRILLLAAAFSLASLGLAGAQPSAQPAVDITQAPAAAQPSDHFDADAATEAYMAMIPAAARARSDAYFEGGYWLVLWNFLASSLIAVLLLETRLSARMRDLAERITRFKALQTMLYWVQYLAAITILGFPLGFYENYVREHQYGLATQSFGPWMGDEIKGLLLNLVIGALALALLFGIVRRLAKSWWMWGAIAASLLMIVTVALGPVFIQPIFNHPKKLADVRITDPILRLAHANGIAANDVYEIDASLQSKRMSANVSGFGNTMRITLNDNLLRRGSPEEIQAVMGHEMGHYVLNHIPKQLFFNSVEFAALFAFLAWGLNWSLKRWGEHWQIRSVSDPAVLPLVVLLVGALFFVLTPVDNTVVRMQEAEADVFGLNASRLPDGFAQAAIHLGEYRKMHPGPVEEFLFYDHPSGYRRIHAAMVWKSQNLELYAKPVPAAPAAAVPVKQ